MSIPAAVFSSRHRELRVYASKPVCACPPRSVARSSQRAPARRVTRGLLEPDLLATVLFYFLALSSRPCRGQRRSDEDPPASAPSFGHASRDSSTAALSDLDLERTTICSESAREGDGFLGAVKRAVPWAVSEGGRILSGAPKLTPELLRASLHRDRRVPCTCGAALVIAMAAAISLRTEAAAQEVDGFGMPVAYARVPGSQPESPRLGSWALRKPMRLSFATYNIRSIMDRWHEREVFLRDTLRSLRCHVVAMQEVLTHAFEQDAQLMGPEYAVQPCRAALANIRDLGWAGRLYSATVDALLAFPPTRALLAALPATAERLREGCRCDWPAATLARDLTVLPFFGNSMALHASTVASERHEVLSLGCFRAAHRVLIVLHDRPRALRPPTAPTALPRLAEWLNRRRGAGSPSASNIGEAGRGPDSPSSWHSGTSWGVSADEEDALGRPWEAGGGGGGGDGRSGAGAGPSGWSKRRPGAGEGAGGGGGAAVGGAVGLAGPGSGGDRGMDRDGPRPRRSESWSERMQSPGEWLLHRWEELGRRQEGGHESGTRDPQKDPVTGHSVPHSRTLRPAQEGLAEWARRVLVPPALRESSVAVWVVNTHLDHADAGRRAQQMERVLGWMEPVAGEAAAVVIAGDLNAPPDEPTHALLAKHRFVSAHASIHGREPDSTWPSGLTAPLMDDGDPFCADFVYVRPSPGHRCRVLRAELVGQHPHPSDPTLFPSDHVGLRVDIEFDRDVGQ